MQDESSRGDVAQELDGAERAVLYLLLDGARPPMWSVAELGGELGSELAAMDAVAGLHGAGLVHRCHEFVFATRAAARFNALADGL
ncbi:MAG TPA: hypothetical protein VN812_05885 [Candidatus Acidoferrales bacterium]|nr:hypothetical protein [Candidatus Acidoferrales bacterium]